MKMKSLNPFQQTHSHYTVEEILHPLWSDDEETGTLLIEICVFFRMIFCFFFLNTQSTYIHSAAEEKNKTSLIFYLDDCLEIHL